jgi:hypothetical protein
MNLRGFKIYEEADVFFVNVSFQFQQAHLHIFEKFRSFNKIKWKQYYTIFMLYESFSAFHSLIVGKAIFGRFKMSSFVRQI